SMRFIVAFLARCYRAERRGRFVWLYWWLRQRGGGSRCRDGGPSRAAARPSGCSSATTPRQAAGALALLVRVARTGGSLWWTPGATRGMFSTASRDHRETDDGRACR